MTEDREVRFLSDEEFAAAIHKLGGVHAAMVAGAEDYISPDIHSDLYDFWHDTIRAWGSYSIQAQDLHEHLEYLLPRQRP